MNGSLTEIIRSKYRQVTEQIAQAACSVGRRPSSVCLIVVTKGHPLEKVRAAIQAGIRQLGENYAEEGAEKIISLGRPDELEWHMIGHVQSRKAALVCEYYDCVQSVDSLKLARRLDRFSGEAGRKLPIMLECNVSGEASKYGFPVWREAHRADMVSIICEILALPNLALHGLMTIAPYFEEAESARPYFRRLHVLRDYLSEKCPGANLCELSMGMSDDFQVAIQEGATMVRIGTAIMGQRQEQVDL
jgi:pyridoxal phosphate enzyme (YggS family)